MSTSINTVVVKLVEIREAIKKINTEKKDLEEVRSQLELEVLSLLDDQEVTLMRSKAGTISIAESEIAQVEDWDEFENFIYKNRALYLLQRRPSNPAYRELIKTDGNVPGVVSYIKRTINLRKN